jgi:hypothetical protein
VRDCLLKPRNNLGRGLHSLFRQIAIHFIAEADIDAGIPQPANPYIDFAVVDFLKFYSQIHIPILRKPCTRTGHRSRKTALFRNIGSDPDVPEYGNADPDVLAARLSFASGFSLTGVPGHRRMADYKRENGNPD